MNRAELEAMALKYLRESRMGMRPVYDSKRQQVMDYIAGFLDGCAAAAEIAYEEQEDKTGDRIKALGEEEK